MCGSKKPDPAAARVKVEIPIDKRQWHPSPLPGLVVLVSTVNLEGEPNVAPKSWISMVAFGPPPVLMFGCNLEHATARNVRGGGGFVVNVPAFEIAARVFAMGNDGASQGAERLSRYGLDLLPALRVKAPRVASCRAHIECELDDMKTWGPEVAIFGRIVAASMDGAALSGDETTRYGELAPFFYLEGGFCAPLGWPRLASEARAGAHHALTILAVQSIPRAAHFYRGVFGWPARVDEPVYVELALPDGRGLGLYDRRGFAHNTNRLPLEVPEAEIAPTELYLYCDDLEDIIKRLDAAGSRKLADLSLRGWGDEVAYYADPDGNVLAVARRLHTSP